MKYSILALILTIFALTSCNTADNTISAGGDSGINKVLFKTEVINLSNYKSGFHDTCRSYSYSGVGCQKISVSFKGNSNIVSYPNLMKVQLGVKDANGLDWYWNKNFEIYEELFGEHEYFIDLSNPAFKVDLNIGIHKETEDSLWLNISDFKIKKIY